MGTTDLLGKLCINFPQSWQVGWLLLPCRHGTNLEEEVVECRSPYNLVPKYMQLSISLSSTKARQEEERPTREIKGIQLTKPKFVL